MRRVVAHAHRFTIVAILAVPSAPTYVATSSTENLDSALTVFAPAVLITEATEQLYVKVCPGSRFKKEIWTSVPCAGGSTHKQPPPQRSRLLRLSDRNFRAAW